MCSARPGSPLTVTRPALISSSAFRREATPARRARRSGARLDCRFRCPVRCRLSDCRLRHTRVSHASNFRGYGRLGEEAGAPWLTRQQNEGAGREEKGVRRSAAPPVIIGFVPHYVTLMRWTSQGVAGLPAWRERVEDGRADHRRGRRQPGRRLRDARALRRGRDLRGARRRDRAEIILKLQRHGAEHTETLRALHTRRGRRDHPQALTAGRRLSATASSRARISSASPPRSSSRGSAASDSSPNTRSKSGVVL